MNRYNLMIKPASSICNLRCRYCFYNDIAERRDVVSFGIMQDDVLNDILISLKNSLKPGDCISIAFQGGEPTVTGLDYFEKFTAAMSERNPGVHIQYALQTNATMLDDCWCEFLREHHFLVGVSYDILNEFHDAARVDASGRPSGRRVLQTIQNLKKHGVEFNILCTLTNQIARHPQQIWKRIEQLDLQYVQFTPCIGSLTSLEESVDTLTPKRFAGFYNTLFLSWLEAYRKGKYRSIKLFDDVIHRLAFGQCNMCGMDGKCHAQLVVESDGTVYPCDFYCLDEYRIGNLRNQTLQELLSAPQAEAFVSRWHPRPQLCENCKFVNFCGGNCKRMQREICCSGNETFCGYRDFLLHNIQILQWIAKTERRLIE